MSIATAGKVVTFHYTLKDDDGEVLDTSDGDEPMEYLHGADNIVPGLEQKLEGAKVGAHVDAVVAPEDGYGAHSGGKPVPIDRDQFPEDVELFEGMSFMAQGSDGMAAPVWITSVEDDQVFIDFNHPLAGVTLHFSVDIVEIRDATEEELAHGHPHGPDGHDCDCDDDDDDDDDGHGHGGCDHCTCGDH